MARDSGLSPSTPTRNALGSAAAWKRLPGDPTTAIGWIFRKRSLLDSFDRRYFVRALLGSTIVLVALAALSLYRHKGLDVLFPAAFVSIGLMSNAWKWRRPSDGVHATLPTLTDEPEAVPVALTVFDERGEITGRDDGWVAFADGWLVYEGVRTEFSLTKEAVGLPYEYVASGVTLRLYDGRRIAFAAMSSSGAQILESWFRAWSTEPIASGISTLPPRAEHPEKAVERLAFPPTYGALALFLAMIADAFFGPELVPPFLGLAAGCLFWFMVRLVRFWRGLPGMVR